MVINKIGSSISEISPKASPQQNAANAFGSFLKEALTEVNNTQIEADEMRVRMALKDPTIELHDLTISAEKASIALSVTLAIKDRLIEGYKEIMRMQV